MMESSQWKFQSPPDLSYLDETFSYNYDEPVGEPVHFDEQEEVNPPSAFGEPVSMPERCRNERPGQEKSNQIESKNDDDDDDVLIEYFRKMREGRLPREDIDQFEPVDVTSGQG